MKVLVTGFGPFEGVDENPTKQIIEKFNKVGKVPTNVHLDTFVLPVETKAAEEILDQYYESNTPDAVVHLGIAVKDTTVRLERIALNLDDFRNPDNTGQVITDRPIVEGGPLAIRTGLPDRALMLALKEEDIEARLSYSAGAYLCNHVFYYSAYKFMDQGSKVIFVHVPPVEYLSTDQGVRLVEVILERLSST